MFPLAVHAWTLHLLCKQCWARALTHLICQPLLYRLHRRTCGPLKHNSKPVFWLFFFKRLISDYILRHLRDRAQMLLSQEYISSFKLIWPQSLTCRWQPARWGFVTFMWLKITAPSTRVTGAPSALNERLCQTGLSAFHQATTHQLSLLRRWVLDQNNFIWTRTSTF